MLRSIALALSFLSLALPGHAADFSDPTWPCIQRKVESLSAGLMWAVPFDETTVPEDPDVRQDMKNLSDALSLRRIDLEDLRPTVEDFAARHKGDTNILGGVFMAAFDSLDTRRTRIIGGIGDFSLSQIALAEQIKSTRLEMEAQMARDAPDFDEVDALEEQLDWDQVIYSDRQKSIQYLCETPVIIEKRLFAIAQMLQQLVQDQR